jgi:hypothetical protein
MDIDPVIEMSICTNRWKNDFIHINKYCNMLIDDDPLKRMQINMKYQLRKKMTTTKIYDINIDASDDDE